jgi:hypothetical protein
VKQRISSFFSVQKQENSNTKLSSSSETAIVLVVTNFVWIYLLMHNLGMILVATASTLLGLVTVSKRHPEGATARAFAKARAAFTTVMEKL